MEINIYQVDAFATEVFQGNPAAVCPLQKWLPDVLLQKIAEENNLSETVFFVPEQDGYRLRWFTPEAEVDLCGHATLATAHVIFCHLSYPGEVIHFYTRSGLLKVDRIEERYRMRFPASNPQPIDCPEVLQEALGVRPVETLSAFDYIVVLENETVLRSIQPNFVKLTELDLRGVVATAKGDSCDIVARCFFPKHRINEDPVTGSAFCELLPYWQEKLGKSSFKGEQLSRRKGFLDCEIHGQEVVLIGSAVDFLSGKICL